MSVHSTDDVAKVYVQRGPERIGHVDRKALYREYTDASFRPGMQALYTVRA